MPKIALESLTIAQLECLRAALKAKERRRRLARQATKWRRKRASKFTTNTPEVKP